MIKPLPNLRLFFSLLFVSLIICLFDYLNFLNYPKQFLSFLSTPISFTLYKSGQNLKNQFHFIFAARFAARENKALKEQFGTLLSENTILKKRLSEAEAQLTQFEFISPTTYKLVAARPIGLARYLKIDKGFESSVRIGQAVVFKDNYIGKIKEVSPTWANIQLIEDPDSKVAAFSQGLGGRAKGVVVGQFGNDTVMDKILHEENIEVGDLVYSEGTEGFLPRGLILGKVVEVINRQNEVFKQAKIKAVFDIRDLDLVFVIVE